MSLRSVVERRVDDEHQLRYIPRQRRWWHGLRWSKTAPPACWKNL